MIVKATTQEKLFARKKAEERVRFKASYDSVNSKLDPHHNDFEVNYLGILAEKLFERVFTGAVLNFSPYKGGDDGVDAVWRGMKFQIKTSFRDDADLTIRYSHQVQRDEPVCADVFVLVTPVKRRSDHFNIMFIPYDVARHCIEQQNTPDGYKEIVRAEHLSTASILLYKYWFQKA